jgi:hypothetical protein
MIRRVLHIAAAFACCAAAAGASPAWAQQDPPRDPPRQDRRTRDQVPPAQDRQAPAQDRQYDRTADAQAPQARRAKSVLGSKVSIQGGVSIGTVEDIIFSDDGYIDYLVVLNDGKYVTVPWQAATFNFAQQQSTVSVNITPQQFQQVPTFTQQQWPNFYAPAYRQQIFGFYGIQPGRDLRPGQERRIERRDGIRRP